MTAVHWPSWVAWLLAIAILLTLFFVWGLVGQLSAMRQALGQGQGGGIRSRKELEEAYVAGRISRDAYERLKARLS